LVFFFFFFFFGVITAKINELLIKKEIAIISGYCL
jgi:hypothetical protein